MNFNEPDDLMYRDEGTHDAMVADLDFYRLEHDHSLAKRDREQDYTPVRGLEEKQSETKGTGPNEQAGPVPVPSTPRVIEGVRPAASLRASRQEATETTMLDPGHADRVVALHPRRPEGSVASPAPPPYFDPPEAA